MARAYFSIPHTHTLCLRSPPTHPISPSAHSLCLRFPFSGLASLPLTSPLATAKHTGHHVVVANHTRFSSPPPSHPPRVGYFEKTTSTTTAKTAEPPSDCDWRTIPTATTTTNTEIKSEETIMRPVSQKWGYIRIMAGTILGGILGFYVMHRVESNYKERMNERLRNYEAELRRKKDERLNEFEESSKF
ncbi:uncharacterized protein LOC114194794 [Vigna unguiculata]|uniref:uncharacterized protein LOC114194794 n=1 Tax=Vigna unguiculata TaxID=3917 RepID=UPI001015DC6B|nr:uncharacterized protein LOC114194794 [Vigna unguiculata]